MVFILKSRKSKAGGPYLNVIWYNLMNYFMELRKLSIWVDILEAKAINIQFSCDTSLQPHNIF